MALTAGVGACSEPSCEVAGGVAGADGLGLAASTRVSCDRHCISRSDGIQLRHCRKAVRCTVIDALAAKTVGWPDSRISDRAAGTRITE